MMDTALKIEGYELVTTGGGCTALEKVVGELEFLITNGDLEAPTSFPCELSVFANMVDKTTGESVVLPTEWWFYIDDADDVKLAEKAIFHFLEVVGMDAFVVFSPIAEGYMDAISMNDTPDWVVEKDPSLLDPDTNTSSVPVVAEYLQGYDFGWELNMMVKMGEK